MLSVVAVQTFAGAFDLGATQAGFELVHKAEQLGGFGLPAAIANRHLLGDRWATQACAPAEWEAVDADLIISNPPCSGFSVGSNREFRGANSPINACMWSTVEYAARCNSRAIAFESVTPAYTRPDGRALMQALRARLEELTGDTWTLTHLKHDAYALGNVQIRRRYFWVALRGDQPLCVDPAPVNADQVLWDAIGDLESVPLSWEAQPYLETAAASPYVTESGLRSLLPGFEVNGHQVHDGEGLHASRMSALLRGDWRQGETVEQAAKRYYSRNGRLPLPWTEAQAKKMLTKEWRSSFWPTVRWNASKPAKVIHGGALYNAIHPTQPRALTHREVARVMGFPDTWSALPWAAERGGYLYWGKGITVQCGRWLGEQLREHLNGQSAGAYAGEQLSEREFLIDIKRRKEVLV